MFSNLISELNAPTAQERLAALTQVKKQIDRGELCPEVESGSVNNHIHTTYSFSPYSPTLAVYMAWKNGLKTAGIMDHDTIGGAKEFLEAGRIMDLKVTVGLECRVSMKDTRLSGRRINNPDQKGVAYVAIHGVPHQNIDAVNAFFAPYREARNRRNQAMCRRISDLLSPYGIALDFTSDVLPLSNAGQTGSVTERHILFALAKKIAKQYQTPEAVCTFLSGTMGIPLSDKVKSQILSNDPVCYLYDILGALKSNMVEQFYIDADQECPAVSDYIALADRVGAISAYAYLGDVGDSVTGDKKTQKFEDDYLDLLFEELVHLGFRAVTYMPTRNTEDQLSRVIQHCEKNGLFQISGEDINSPRQSFLCKALEKQCYTHLFSSTYALIGHELAATDSLKNGMFTPETIAKYPALKDRVAHFEEIGRHGLR